MGWLDALERRAREAVGCPRCSHARTPPVKPRPKADIKAVPVQTAAPFGSSPGAITVGYYSVQEGVVVMHDAAGISTGMRQHLRAGEDPRGVAYLMTRESWQAKTPDFDRAIDYPTVGVA